MTRRLGLVASTLATFGLALAVALPAAATDDSQPDPGDDRATAYPGNAVTCEDAGLSGEIVEGLRIFINEERTIFAIASSSIPDGIELTGIVVKGGDAYNVYPGDVLTGLHAPLNNGGQIPQVSHWYACGVEEGTTTTPTTTETSTTTSTSSETTTTESTTSDSTATTTSESSETTTTSDSESTTTSSAVVSETTSPGGGTSPGGDDDDLAETGFSTRGPLVAGGGLLLLGAALLFAVRASRRQTQG